MIQKITDSLFTSFLEFCTNVGLTSSCYTRESLHVIYRKRAAELYYIPDNQLELLQALIDSSYNPVFTGTQVGWFKKDKNGEFTDFVPSLQLIDALSKQEVMRIHLDEKTGQIFLHGQDVRLKDAPDRIKGPDGVNLGIVISEGIVIGLGKIENTGVLRNIIDKGVYIRSERRKHGS